MNNSTKKVIAIFVALLLVFGSGYGTFAIPVPFDNPYLVHGNDSGASTIFYYAGSSDVFLDASGYLTYKIDSGEIKNKIYWIGDMWISLSINGYNITWTSSFPIQYAFAKSGNLSNEGPVELETNNNNGSQYGYLFEYPGGAKTGTVTTYPKAISHLTFFYKIQELETYEISITKEVSGDENESNPTFYFELADATTHTTVATASLKEGETAQFTPEVPEGNYYIREVNPPPGYTPQNNISVPASEVVTNPTYTFTNRYEELTYNVSVKKDIIGDLPNPAKAFYFELVKVTEGDPDVHEVIETITIHNEGTAYFASVPEGTYFVRETDPGQHYDSSGDTAEFMLGPNNPSVEKSFTNTHLTYEIDVSKYTFYDDIYDPSEYTNGFAMSVALLPEEDLEFTFELYNIDDPSNPVLVDTLTLSEFGSGKFIPVEAGKYRVVEVGMPSHFRQVTVGEDDDLIKEVELGGENGWEGAYFRFYNQRLYDIIVNKEISGGGPNSTFTFNLYKVGSPEVVDQITIEGSGSKAFKPVPSGEYYVRELTPPNGYTLVGDNDLAAEVNSEQPEDEVDFTNRYTTTETTETTTGTTEETTETTTVTTETTETTEETTEIITTEPVPLDLDIIYAVPEIEELTEEETPLGVGLPQTGQLPAGLFYGLGSLLSAVGVYIKKRR